MQALKDPFFFAVEECKKAWCSLRDSRRYHASLAKKKKSGDAGGEHLSPPILNDCGEWEYSELLSFLPETASKRKYVFRKGFISSPFIIIQCLFSEPIKA